VTTAGVHRAAATGFADGADVYAASRPAYPGEALDWLRDRIGIGPDSRVVEVGAGTGLFTRLILQTGAKVLATDPVAEMLAHLAAAVPGAATAIATVPATVQRAALKPSATNVTPNCAPHPPNFITMGAPRATRCSSIAEAASISATATSMTVR